MFSGLKWWVSHLPAWVPILYEGAKKSCAVCVFGVLHSCRKFSEGNILKTGLGTDCVSWDGNIHVDYANRITPMITVFFAFHLSEQCWVEREREREREWEREREKRRIFNQNISHETATKKKTIPYSTWSRMWTIKNQKFFWQIFLFKILIRRCLLLQNTINFFLFFKIF